MKVPFCQPSAAARRTMSDASNTCVTLPESWQLATLAVEISWFHPGWAFQVVPPSIGPVHHSSLSVVPEQFQVWSTVVFRCAQWMDLPTMGAVFIWM